MGTILWFDQKTKLKNFIIPNPMRLVFAIRRIINHSIEKCLEKEPLDIPLNDLVRLGKLTMEAFQKLYPPQESEELSQEDLKDFLEELGLAYRIHCSLDDTELFVPSMICDGNEESMREKLDTMKKDPRCLSIVYLIQKTSKDCHIFQDVLYQTIYWKLQNVQSLQSEN